MAAKVALALVVAGGKLGYETGDPAGSSRSFVGGGGTGGGAPSGGAGPRGDVVRAVLVHSHVLPEGGSGAQEGDISGGVDFEDDKPGAHSSEGDSEGRRFEGVLFRGDFLKRRNKIANFGFERGRAAADYQ